MTETADGWGLRPRVTAGACAGLDQVRRSCMKWGGVVLAAAASICGALRGVAGEEVCVEEGSCRGAGGDEMGQKVEVLETTDDLSIRVGELVLETVKQQKAKNGPTAPFMVALSGGSLPKLLAAGLLDKASEIDFSTWHVFFADERYVGHDHQDSNLKSCQDHFLSKIPGISPDHVYGIDISVPVEESAKLYQEHIARVSGVPFEGNNLPVFDLILLGMGPDGHTCSLFPGHPLLHETSSWVAPIKDSPKPPPQRITLTYPVLNNAANVFFLAAGESKEDVIPLCAISPYRLKDLGEDALPAARVQPTSGRLVWLIDSDAAGKL